MITIGKEFIWQMAHRLPYHLGGCQNIHGHSYKLILTLKGELNENGMLLDFYDITNIVNPFLFDKLDHAFLCSKDDLEIIKFFEENNMKHFVMQNYSTCENMCKLFFDTFKDEFKKFDNIKELGVRVYETADAYAEIGPIVIN